MATQKRNKIQNIYLNDETHQTFKKLAAHQGSTIQAAAANFLEENQPAVQEMVKALDDIKSGKDMGMVLQNLLAKGLQMAGENLKTEEDDQDATDNRQSD